MSDSKPVLLYHGTPHPVNGELRPRSSRGDQHGDFPGGPRDLLFATANEKYARAYSLKTHEGHMLNCGVDGERIFATVINREGWEASLEAMNPSVYVLDGSSFLSTAKPGKPSGNEWISEVPVAPLRRYHVSKEMIMADGAQLFCIEHPHITPDVWHKWADTHLRTFKPGDSGFVLPAALQEAGLLEHENARLGIEPVDLTKYRIPHRFDEAIYDLKRRIARESARQIFSIKLTGDPHVHRASKLAMHMARQSGNEGKGRS